MATRKLSKSSAMNDPVDVNELIQDVLRESYEQCTADLREYAAKVRDFNSAKSVVRDYVAALRKLKTDVVLSARGRGVAVGCGAEKEASVVAALLKQKSRSWKPGKRAAGLCIPDRLPVAEVTSISLLDHEIAQWEDKLRGIGDDAQLSMLELQSALQTQNQVFTIRSNVLKVLNDTTMAIIHNIRA